MSLLAMPLVVVNLGCEMLYILEQRLKAQNISNEKSNKVLHDVVRTMFDKEYVEKLFSPQELYSVSSTRKIFDRLAHSSIMRLSESSMDKLFDLMMMGFKYQLLCSTKLDQLLEVTLTHLAEVKRIMSPITDANILGLIANVEGLMQATYSAMTMGQLHLLRQTLQRFFQDKRVKVSLFLQEGIQSSAGRLILPSPASSTTGTVTCYDLSGGLESQERSKLKCLDFDLMEFFIHPVPLGTNLYNKDRPKVVPPPRKGDVIQTPQAIEDMLGGGKSQYAEDVLERAASGSGRKELNLLSALLAMKPAPADNFKLSLFEGDGEPGGAAGGAARPSVISLQFGQEGKNEAYKQQGLGNVLKSLTIDDQKKTSGNDDLLDLLDSAN